MTLAELLEQGLLPYRMAEDLAEHDDDPAFQEDMVRQYLEADEVSQAEMAAFHDSNGIAMIESAIEQIGEEDEPSGQSGDRTFG